MPNRANIGMDIDNTNENRPRRACFRLHLAERVGFEPTIRYNRIPDFESGAFDLSATFPDSLTSHQGGLVASH